MEEKDKNVIVVSLDKYSFDVLLEKKFYAFPIGTRKIMEYFAFYRDGKIIYYGKVKDAKKVNKSELGFGYWLNCFPDSEPPFEMVTFDKIGELENPIEKDNIGRGRGYIYGIRYTTLKNLLKSKKISDLFKTI